MDLDLSAASQPPSTRAGPGPGGRQGQGPAALAALSPPPLRSEQGRFVNFRGRRAPYNVCFDGDEVAGVFDWDLAGPTTPLMELAFIAWNCVPLWRDIGDEASAERIQRICSAYGGIHPAQLVHAVPAGSR